MSFLQILVFSFSLQLCFRLLLLVSHVLAFALKLGRDVSGTSGKTCLVVCGTTKKTYVVVYGTTTETYAVVYGTTMKTSVVCLWYNHANLRCGYLSHIHMYLSTTTKARAHGYVS